MHCIILLIYCLVDARAQVGYPPQTNAWGPLDPRRSNPPNPGDVDYRTYVFNSRRYGETYPTYDPRFPNPAPNMYPSNKPVFNPQDGSWRYPPSYLTPTVPMPGVLGGWRPDLQGKQRPDYLQLQQNRDIYVTTAYGEVCILYRTALPIT